MGANGSPVVSFGNGGFGPGGMRVPGYRMMSPASATGPPLVAGQHGPGATWIPTSSGSYIIQSPTAPINPNEVFHLSPSGKNEFSIFTTFCDT